MEVTDAQVLADLKALHNYYKLVIEPRQVRLMEQAQEKADGKVEDGHVRPTEIRGDR